MWMVFIGIPWFGQKDGAWRLALTTFLRLLVGVWKDILFPSKVPRLEWHRNSCAGISNIYINHPDLVSGKTLWFKQVVSNFVLIVNVIFLVYSIGIGRGGWMGRRAHPSTPQYWWVLESEQFADVQRDSSPQPPLSSNPTADQSSRGSQLSPIAPAVRQQLSWRQILSGSFLNSSCTFAFPPSTHYTQHDLFKGGAIAPESGDSISPSPFAEIDKLDSTVFQSTLPHSLRWNWC